MKIIARIFLVSFVLVGFAVALFAEETEQAGEELCRVDDCGKQQSGYVNSSGSFKIF